MQSQNYVGYPWFFAHRDHPATGGLIRVMCIKKNYLDWFHKKDDAISYAKQWANSKVTDGLTNEIVWKFQ
ncbi:hypothetical protein C7459_103135 [Tumebacillus permanentifrigoris]|uniref:Uncharacterized protein n=1 Tax=Tumebacillus permanentifrigoris TaxID=378543 RepID=A0A316DD26_9BACL|nr:hypothetical protein C7459_103135 [Tumebacillus permanentifrigoris]